MIRQLKIHNKTVKRPLWSLLIVTLCLLFSSSVFSLGLGGIKLKSSLNQKLDADIELISVGDLELSDISIKLASPAVYDRMGIERSSLFDQLKFEVSKTDAGEYIIHVSTPLSINEPFLNFLVEVNWASGRLIREFTVLLDPPVFLENEGDVKLSTPEIASQTQEIVPLPEEKITPSEPVVAQQSPEPEPAPVERAPVEEPVIEEQVSTNESDVNEEISNILAGEDRAAEIVTDVTEAPIDLAADEQQPSGSLVYQKVKQNEFLWGIANKMRPADVTVEQMMLGLLRENPDAFFGDNVSMLKAGAVLRIEDSASLSNLSANQAILEIAQQNKDWLSYRKERQARNAVAVESANMRPMGSEAESQSGASATVPDVVNAASQPLLELVAPFDDSKSDSKSSNAALEASEEKVNELNIELVMATEEMEARKRENEDLVTRLNSLEEQMSAMQSLVQLKDAELAKIRTSEITVEGEAVLEVGKSAQVESESTVTKVVSKELDPKEEQQLWQDPVTLATIVAAILLIALGVVLLRRRSNEGRMTAEELEASEKTLDELLNMDSDSTTRITSIIGDDSFIEDERRQPDISGIDKVDVASNDLDPMTEVLSEDTVFMNSGMEVLDPLSEADVYITYERFDKAEELLKNAIQTTPDRQELKLKLLEVYAASGNTDMFDNQADEFYAAIDGDELHPLWQEATAVAHAIGSTNPLFSAEAEITPKKTLSEYDESIFDEDKVSEDEASTDTTRISNIEHIGSKTTQVVNTIPEENWESNKELELPEREPENDILDTQIESYYPNHDDSFDSSMVDKVSAQSEENNEKYKREALIAGVETIHLDMDGDELNISSDSLSVSKVDANNTTRSRDSKVELSDEDLTSAMTSNSVNSNVDSLIQDNENETRSSVIVSDAFNDSFPDREPTSIAEARRQAGDNTFFLLSDEVGTKLDLARAYIEMGDYDGASDLLEEVMSEGSKQQRRQAKKLMRKTGT